MRFRREDLKIEGGRNLYLYHFDQVANLNQKQAHIWSKVATDWETESEFVEAWFGPISEAMNAHLGPGPGVLLDEGCGAQTMPLPRGWNSIGLDVSPSMLQNSGKTVVAAASNIPFQNNSFDAVMSRCAIMLEADLSSAFDEAYRVLMPGGAFVFSTWTPPEENLFAPIPFDILSRGENIPPPAPDAPGAYALADPERIRSLALGAGFDIEELSKIECPFLTTIPAKEAAERVIQLAGPLRTLFDRKPQDAKPAILNEIADAFARADLTCHSWVVSLRRPKK